MAKRHRWDDESDRGSSRRRSQAQRHLCVVLDDWSRGYSIYKLDVDGFDGDPDDTGLDLRAERLPFPPAFRLEVPEGERGRFARFAAAGSRIFALHYKYEDRDAPALVYDLSTGALGVGPATPVDLQNRPKLVSAGGRVYAVGRMGRREHSFKALAPHGRRGWVWSRLRFAPFDLARAACHAAHPRRAHRLLLRARRGNLLLRRRGRGVGVARPVDAAVPGPGLLRRRGGRVGGAPLRGRGRRPRLLDHLDHD
ncbi:unnamed protein product [Urochloa humidicola]